jgi:hypothetical protein
MARTWKTKEGIQTMNAESHREGEGQGIEQSGSVWAELGLPEPQPADSGQGPAVDWALLRRLVRRELPEQAARMTYRLIEAYSEWNAAHAQILIEEFKSHHADERS